MFIDGKGGINLENISLQPNIYLSMVKVGYGSRLALTRTI